MEDQPDGNYHLILAWARYVQACPWDREFVVKTYSTIKRFADYYLEPPGYWDGDLQLLRNPAYEHAREGRYWNAYDLITNVFASQALYELSSIAEREGDKASAMRWEGAARKLADGVHRHLTATVDGRRIYAEMIAVDQDGRFYPGFAYVNLAPVAVDWFAMDRQIMADTYALYLKYGSHTWGQYQMLGTIEGAGQVVGKTLAWELWWNHLAGNENRIKELLGFVETYTRLLGVEILPENWNIAADGRVTVCRRRTGRSSTRIRETGADHVVPLLTQRGAQAGRIGPEAFQSSHLGVSIRKRHGTSLERR